MGIGGDPWSCWEGSDCTRWPCKGPASSKRSPGLLDPAAPPRPGATPGTSRDGGMGELFPATGQQHPELLATSEETFVPALGSPVQTAFRCRLGFPKPSSLRATQRPAGGSALLRWPWVGVSAASCFGTRCPLREGGNATGGITGPVGSKGGRTVPPAPG